MNLNALLRYTHAVVGTCPGRGYTVLELTMSEFEARQSVKVWRDRFGYANVDAKPIESILQND